MGDTFEGLLFGNKVFLLRMIPRISLRHIWNILHTRTNLPNEILPYRSFKPELEYWGDEGTYFVEEFS